MKNTIILLFAVSLFTAISPNLAFSTPNEKNNAIEIPPEAVKVTGVSRPVINLNDPKGSGVWKFLFENPDGISTPFEQNQNFDFTLWANKEWHNVIVPSGLAIQGFDIKNNNEYYYQTNIAIPSDYAGNRILVRFDAVYTNTRVWIDGQYIRTHRGGFTTWDCDITDFATPGTTVTMTVGVTDIDIDTPGIWNPTGISITDPSRASIYANHNMGGITRDVYLMTLPKDYIARIYTNTVFTDNTFTDANLNIEAQLGMVSANASLLFEVVDKGGSAVASGTLNFDNNKTKLSDMESVSLFVKVPLKWDAERPNLYTLRTTLTVGTDVKQVNEQRFGFRQIDFGGSFGDVNKVYVNGMEVKLRGACRHDVSWQQGRSTSKELDYQEIRDYKDVNINFIRTSHYPVSRHLLDACDEMGMYVENENAACWGPIINADPVIYLNGFKEMVERDRNRACVLIWSIANESTWGEEFDLGYEFIKKTDTTRPIIYSWPDYIPDSLNIKLDIFSMHYDEWDSENLGKPDIPVLNDEYAPSTVHNYSEIQRDLNARNFWGMGMHKFWDNMMRSDGALGGALWCASDDVIFIPENVTRRIGPQGDHDGTPAGNALWGTVHDAYKRFKPEAWHTKKAYSPIRLDEKNFTLTDKLTIPVRNNFNHTNFHELTIEYSLDGGAAKTYIPPSIPPRGQGVLTFDIAQGMANKVNVKFYTTFNDVRSMVDEYNIYLEKPQYSFVPESAKPPAVNEKRDNITVSGEDFSILFDKTTGLIKEAKYKNDVLLTGGPYFYTTVGDFGKWIPAKSDGITAKKSGKYVVVTLKGNYEEGQGVEFVLNISGNGIITTNYTLTTPPTRADNLQEVGINFDIPSDIERVSWIKDSYHSAYPESHIGRPVGTALKVRPGYEKTPDLYGVKPEWGWEMDMNDFVLYVNNDPNDGIVTNDFKSMRENIWTYDINFNGTPSRICVESEGKAAARVEVKSGWEFIDCMDERIKYNGTWEPRYNALSPGWEPTIAFNYSYNRSEMISSSDGDYCELTFTGTGVSLISARGYDLGRAKIYIDGQLMKDVRLHAAIGSSKKRVVYSINGLDYGQHTIKVEQTTGDIYRNSFDRLIGSEPVSIDGFGVLTKERNDLSAQVSRLIINEQWYYPDVRWGSYPGVPGKISEGYTGSATIRLTDTNNLIK